MSDLLYRSERNSDASQEGPTSEREDSDYDEELEVDFETPVPDDEGGRDSESNAFHGSVNLRIHSTGRANGSCESPTSSCQNDKVAYQVLMIMINIFHLHLFY